MNKEALKESVLFWAKLYGDNRSSLRAFQEFKVITSDENKKIKFEATIKEIEGSIAECLMHIEKEIDEA